MRSSNYLMIVILLVLGSCGGHAVAGSEGHQATEAAGSSAKTTVLKKIGETKSVLKTPECAIYDSIRNVVYVSNVDGDPSKKDGNGFISKIDLEGNVTELLWITGLDAPKGMGIYKDFLYVTNIDAIVKIDILTGKVIKSYLVMDSQNLNDIEVDREGALYISDSNLNVIYRLKDDQVELFIKGDKWIFVNGLLMDNEKLLIGTVGTLLSYSFTTKALTTCVDSTGGIDGLRKLGDHRYITSDWYGDISVIEPPAKRTILLHKIEGINAADVEYIASKHLLLVPTFGHNTVSYYQIIEGNY